MPMFVRLRNTPPPALSNACIGATLIAPTPSGETKRRTSSAAPAASGAAPPATGAAPAAGAALMPFTMSSTETFCNSLANRDGQKASTSTFAAFTKAEILSSCGARRRHHVHTVGERTCYQSVAGDGKKVSKGPSRTHTENTARYNAPPPPEKRYMLDPRMTRAGRCMGMDVQHMSTPCRVDQAAKSAV